MGNSLWHATERHRIGAAASDVAGMLNENYVYINLKKRQGFPEEIAFETPAFATYRGGEVDFVVKSLKDSLCYGIEVKAGKGTGNTVKKALDAGKINRLLYLKRDTKGGTEGKVITLPIYCLEQFGF